MHTRRNILIFAGAVIVVLLLAVLLRQHVAQRAVFDGDNAIFASPYVLTGDHSGNLTVMGDSIVLDSDGHVTGYASLAGQNVSIAGRVDGDLTVLGAALLMNSTAHVGGDVHFSGKEVTVDGQIDGDLVLTGGSVTILPSARISGDINACARSIIDQREVTSSIGCSPDFALEGAQITTAGALALAVFGTVVLTGLSALLVTFFPRQISHIEEAMRARPRGFGSVGIAAYALAFGLCILLTVVLAIFPPLGLLLVPVFLILGLLLLILTLTGLVTLAVMLGDALLRRASKTPSPPLISAVFGSLILSAGLAVIALLPFGLAISVLLFGAITSVGLGAALFTRIGTRPVGRTYFIQG